jgi:mRNA-degrading endonuclease RelE of RelBE toxin-antitoxin system
MSGYANQYRCRVGKIRIIFVVTINGNFIVDIDFRGGAYK